jgi:hypothetical protein
MKTTLRPQPGWRFRFESTYYKHDPTP